MKTGMQPAMKISLVRRDEAESPGIIRQNTVSCMVSRTCTRHQSSTAYAAGIGNVTDQRPQRMFSAAAATDLKVNDYTQGPVRCTSIDIWRCM